MLMFLWQHPCPLRHCSAMPPLPKGEALAHSQVLHYYNKVGRPLQRVDGPIGALLGKLLLCEVLANIDSNSHDDDKALHDVSVRRVDVHELQSDLHQLEDQHTDEDAGDSADTAGGGDAAGW